HLDLVSFAWVVIVMFLVSFALTGLGFVIAWQMESTQGFHAIMNLFLIPLWLLSGAVFPSTGAPAWLGWVMRINPLTYGVTALREGLYWELPHPDATVALIVTTVFAIVMFAMALAAAQRTTRGDLQ
ncbi:MAG TPA: ABC transporter permease, partial [Verrucomicrobiae bacterium]|nr:ABC transporter permease [Verrucomicrobiae bacterium]